MTIRDIAFFILGSFACFLFYTAFAWRAVRAERRKLKRQWNKLPIARYLTANDIIK
jgi:hypothetical protein